MNRFAIAVLLAWIGGFVDAVGYLALTQVFVAHMSGNTVALASHFGAGEWSEISRRALALPMFVLGVFCGTLIARALRKKGLRRSFIPIFALEAALLGLFTGLTAECTVPLPISPKLYAFVALLALAMGLQNATLRHARELAVRTTFITGMLVSMAEKSAAYVTRLRAPRTAAQAARRRHEGKLALKYGSLWCGMLAGAVCGAWLLTLWGTLALLLPITALALIILRDFLRPLSET